uniref:Uncharacterized protein n=1 Tax=Strigamia maritima TaxID=126957 RepID=T1IYV8_STRMM
MTTNRVRTSPNIVTDEGARSAATTFAISEILIGSSLQHNCDDSLSVKKYSQEFSSRENVAYLYNVSYNLINTVPAVTFFKYICSQLYSCTIIAPEKSNDITSAESCEATTNKKHVMRKILKFTSVIWYKVSGNLSKLKRVKNDVTGFIFSVSKDVFISTKMSQSESRKKTLMASNLHGAIVGAETNFQNKNHSLCKMKIALIMLQSCSRNNIVIPQALPSSPEHNAMANRAPGWRSIRLQRHGVMN